MKENLDKVLKEYYENNITLPEGLNNKVNNKIFELENDKRKINIFINVSIIILNVALCILLNVFVGALIIKVFLYSYLILCIMGCCLISYVSSRVVKKDNELGKESMVCN